MDLQLELEDKSLEASRNQALRCLYPHMDMLCKQRWIRQMRDRINGGQEKRMREERRYMIDQIAKDVIEKSSIDPKDHNVRGFIYLFIEMILDERRLKEKVTEKDILKTKNKKLISDLDPLKVRVKVTRKVKL